MVSELRLLTAVSLHYVDKPAVSVRLCNEGNGLKAAKDKRLCFHRGVGDNGKCFPSGRAV